MELNSLRFGVFFLIFTAVLLILPKKLRKTWLLLASFAFYLSWERIALIWLLLSSVMVWACALGIRDRQRKHFYLIFPIIWNILLLGIFKYAGLLDPIIRRTGLPLSFRQMAAPLGISFYTLRCISYITAVFRGTVCAAANPADVVIYVSFFPQIISGPIEHPKNFFRELDDFEQKPLRDFTRVWRGSLLFVWGLFQKIVLAERLAMVTAAVFPHFEQYGFWEILAASLAYTLQIYCDFAGYSDMSRGIAAIMGLSTMRNFRQPYLAAGIKQFWRRWHISLTSWLTDHIYIPLGGSRKGLLRRYGNIIIVFIISGLWHGSTLNFLFWGLLHAAFMILSDLRTRAGIRLSRFAAWVITFAEVNFAWIFFNSGGLNRGFRILRQMFSRFERPSSLFPGLLSGNRNVLLGGLLILLIVDLLHESGVSVQEKVSALPLPLRWALILGLFWAVILLGIYGVGYDTGSFIYAKF